MKYKVLKARDIYRMGLFCEGRVMNVKLEADTEDPALLLYKRNEKEHFLKISFPKEDRAGNIWILSLEFEEDLEEGVEYNFTDSKGNIFEDPYGKVFSGRDSFGKEYENPLRSAIRQKDLCKESGFFLNRKLNESIVYRLNVRAFTKSASSKVVHKGTFFALEEKLDYIKSLGVNTVLLMPAQEFLELRKDKRLDIWGYETARHFAPKASYCTKKNRDPVSEYKSMVNAYHKADIEVWQEFYFDKKDTAYTLEVLRYWVREYRLDGIYLSGSFDIESIINDAGLSKTKILASYIDEGFKRENLLVYNDNFQNTMRRFLKGDEGILNEVFAGIRSNPKIKRLKYLADMQGFSLMDVFSYDMKHNEQNGEDNKDGIVYNYSWNCGAEGKTAKKKVLSLREKLYKNALVLSLLSPSVPMICSGDEFGNTRKGNNNAFCRDDDTFYVDWKILKKNESRLNWFKYLVSLRKKYKIFSSDKEFTMLDTISCGMPDMSVHGVQAWKAEFDVHNRQLGIYYSGKYFDKENSEDIYILYNMHWEEHKFSLPHIGKGLSWYMLFDTDSDYEELESLYEAPEKLGEIKSLVIKPRSIVFLIVK
jgi:alpha-amylase family protein